MQIMNELWNPSSHRSFLSLSLRVQNRSAIIGPYLTNPGGMSRDLKLLNFLNHLEPRTTTVFLLFGTDGFTVNFENWKQKIHDQLVRSPDISIYRSDRRTMDQETQTMDRQRLERPIIRPRLGLL